MEEVFDTAAVAVAPLEKLPTKGDQGSQQAVTAYYLMRDFDYANTALSTPSCSTLTSLLWVVS